MGELSVWHVVVVAAVFVLLFGSRRMPDAARSLGRSLRIFKAETRGLREDERAATVPTAAPATTVPAPSGVAGQVAPSPLPHDPAAGQVLINGQPLTGTSTPVEPR